MLLPERRILLPLQNGPAAAMDMSRLKSISFYCGVFSISGSILCLQILQTRIISVMSWYFMAFFAISMAMFGMTVGAMLVYFFDDYFKTESFQTRISQFSIGFAVSTFVGWLFLINSLLFTEYSTPITAALVWLKLIIILAPPYVFGGIVVSLVLTRSPYPVGIVYAVDLVGAAAGCFAVLGLMAFIDGVSALLAVAALGGLAAIFFRLGFDASAADVRDGPNSRPLGWAPIISITVLISLATWLNAAVYPDGGRILFVKENVDRRTSFEAIYWNSFSRIDIGNRRKSRPFMWGPSRVFAALDHEPIDQRWMKIDGQAGTGMMEFSGDRQRLSFLQYDVTNLAYSIRNRGHAAVIGVGGGRDILSAYYFGFDRITGVEINPIFVNNLTKRYSQYNRISAIDGVSLVVDEGRSWFARATQRFDLIQMSLIDTWAATGAGAFSLTENGLYTIEGWKHFLGRLKPDGVFTVSRWYAPANPGETGRIISLAKATLFDLGVSDPNKHIFLAATSRLSTVVVSRSPLSEADLGKLRSTSDRLAFDTLFSPEVQPTDPVIRAIYSAKTKADLFVKNDKIILDFSPPTDDRPFFFNQLRLGALKAAWSAAVRYGGDLEVGVLTGNLVASLVLLIIVAISLAAVVLTIVIPALPVVRRAAPRLICFGTAYFLLIGLGFMFVEIGLMQRLSIFLGHPIYGLVIALAGIIMATGVGSALSECFRLDSPRTIMAWSILTFGYIVSLPAWFPDIVAAFESSGILVRGAISLATIFPAGIALGIWFPTGMRLVQASDSRPTPWFWAVNGSAGVFASGVAVATGTFISIDATLWVASICYVLLCPVALLLLALNNGTKAAAVAN